MRLEPADREALVEMGFLHAVVIAQDVSVRVVGSVVSVFTHGLDALAEAERLSRLYNLEHSFVEESLASAIEAPSGVETGNTGSTEGESAASEAGDAR